MPGCEGLAIAGGGITGGKTTVPCSAVSPAEEGGGATGGGIAALGGRGGATPSSVRARSAAGRIGAPG